MDTFATSKFVVYISINNQNLDPNYTRAYNFADKIPRNVKACFWAAQNYSPFERTSLF